ncbi:hypothetical protein ABH925_002135 [Streptacidiphilus sp. EB129]
MRPGVRGGVTRPMPRKRHPSVILAALDHLALAGRATALATASATALLRRSPAWAERTATAVAFPGGTGRVADGVVCASVAVVQQVVDDGDGSRYAAGGEER